MFTWEILLSLYLLICILLLFSAIGKKINYLKVFLFSVFLTPIAGFWVILKENEKLAGIYIMVKYKCPECELEFTDDQEYCPICEKSGKQVRLRKNIRKII